MTPAETPADPRGLPKRPPRLPDLGRLTDAQKDELIRGLWDTLVAIDRDDDEAPRRGQQPSDTPSTASSEALSERIRTTGPSRRAQAPAPVPSRLRAGLGLFDSRALQIVLIVLGLGFLADFGVGWYQREALSARDRTMRALRNAAFAGLFVELNRVSYEPDKTFYRATMTMQSLTAGAPLYVMVNPVRVLVQKGLVWREVPSGALGGKGANVVKLQGSEDYSSSFRIDADDWSQLIPGYMHVLIESDMLISLNPEPKDDIVERTNRFYVYLKPQDADDEAIRRRSNFRGTPPVFIPMPPH